MAFKDEQLRGIAYLLAAQNADGGIAATRPGDPSGCWTSANALEVILGCRRLPLSRYSAALRLYNFLLDTQLPDGSWPLVVDRTVGSTMTTGNCLTALAIAQQLLLTDPVVSPRHVQSTDRAVKWLLATQNTDGGWGYEPATTPNASTVMATCYAVAGLSTANAHDAIRTFRTALDFVQAIRNPDGGWGITKGAPSNASNTARCLTTLAKHGRESARVVLAPGMKYLDRTRGNWLIDLEGYVSKGAAGQVVFHGNTISEVIRAYLFVAPMSPALARLVDWLLNGQHANGSWALADEQKHDPTIWTWSTAEAVEVLCMVDDMTGNALLKDYLKRPRRLSVFKMTTSILVAIVIVMSMGMLQWPHTLANTWDKLPTWIQVALATLTGTILSILANLLTPLAEKGIDKVQGRAHRIARDS